MVEKTGLLGGYRAVDEAKLKAASAEEQKVVADARSGVQQATLEKVAVLPIGMLICYIAMLLWFKSKGGYRPVGASAH
jgi:hypothetical protein